MSWTVLIVIGVVVVGLIMFLGSGGSDRQTTAGQNSRASGSKKRSKSQPQSVEEIVEGVKTLKQFRALEKKLERAQERLDTVQTEKAYDNTMEKIELLQEAVDSAAQKPLRWQYVPDLDLETPIVHIENAYKVFSADEYKEKRKELGGNDSEWYGLCADDEAERKEPSIKGLLKFRAVVEQALSREETIKRINQIARDADFFDEFLGFLDDGDLSTGDQWYAEQMNQDGLPLAYELYKKGYTTPERCLKIDPEKFRALKGIGPQRVEALIKYQEKVRGRLESSVAKESKEEKSKVEEQTDAPNN